MRRGPVDLAVLAIFAAYTALAALLLALGVNAMLFQPLRRRIQAFIDTRFFRGPSREATREARAEAKATYEA